MSDTQSSEKPRVFVSAFFCQTVIRDNRNLLTAIKLSDAFTIRAWFPLRADGTLDESQPFYPELEVAMVVMFRSDQSREFKAALRGTKPNGERMIGGFESMPVVTSSKKGPYTLNINMKVPVDQEGVFWFEVYADEELAARLPLLIKHETSPLVPLVGRAEAESVPSPETPPAPSE